ncbi:asparagine synthase (glutamine-hydrolyzing) [Litorivivens lipolytica]|uniref:asparagine synthase (glutamine-hydrolyzing) n=1 Tax=Litorivivens lipolytica TaxID=1524264 RepID=A0A7W4W5J0_9GAMM|nr:asparagine synthase (glutamine-hydrolyzing) [Litorivivens lipolytica]MBB3047830.1 asparagine synthase (glutamine-hydrolyzing) [Litorivivens lipolytica]
MCGIAGIFGTSGQRVEPVDVVAMCDALRSRGPDDDGYYINNDIGLGMRRLSIIDLETGNQPIFNEDRSIVVVLNGEIYNYRSLKQSLIKKKHSFYTESDTEVIVHLYEEYGDQCVHQLRGMFAFALWDNNRRKLLLARDRLGIKPLFYGHFHGHFVFGSELKSILQLPWVERQLDWNAVAHLFTFLTTPRAQSILSGINKLEAGHMLTVESNRLPVVTRYWDVEFEPDYDRSEDSFVEELRARLEESVRLRLICDVPFGAFLSGGIDSSSVVATMARQCSQPIKTFSVGFSEQAFNELAHARKVAEAFGTDHHELILEPDVINVLDDIVWDLDEPFGDSSAIPTYMVSKLASQHVKVVQSGDGGDELFAGYDRYCVEQRERRYRYIPGMVRSLMGVVGAQLSEGTRGRNFLKHIALNGPDRYLDAGTLFAKDSQHSLFHHSAAEAVLQADPWKDMLESLPDDEVHWLSALQYLDIKNYLSLDILTKVDRMSMANSLEVRVPLLDHKFVEFAATIPPEFRLHKGNTKHIFKRAMRGILPEDIIDRPKQGFAIPLGEWFRRDLSSFVRDLLLSHTSQSRNIFNADYIERLLSMHGQGRPLDQQLWTLISFELWCRRFLDSPLFPAVDHKPLRRNWQSKIHKSAMPRVH